MANNASFFMNFVYLLTNIITPPLFGSEKEGAEYLFYAFEGFDHADFVHFEVHHEVDQQRENNRQDKAGEITPEGY